MNDLLSCFSKKPAYFTDFGASFEGNSLKLLPELPDNCIDLIVTSPPFALIRKKEYGNEEQEEYVEWLGEFGKAAYPKLKKSGSFVIDLGGAYRRGFPVRSLYNFRVLMHFCDVLQYHLAEDFYWFNPSKLPSPIEWVNKRKIRVKDSVNTVWWFSKSEFPKSDTRNVLIEYSERMKKLLKNPDSYYTPKKRPSGHDISKNFAKDNGGAIPSNLLKIPNTESNSFYLEGCKLVGAKRHPARFPSKLPEFFINMLTDPGDLVVDIFAGSNTTGAIAETLGRKWLSFDENLDYIAPSSFRFISDKISKEELILLYSEIAGGECVDLNEYIGQRRLI